MLIDEYLTWKEHITVIENKVSKNLGLLYRARKVLDSDGIKKSVFLLYTYQILYFMFKIKANTAPCIFENQPIYRDSVFQLDLVRTGLPKVS